MIDRYHMHRRCTRPRFLPYHAAHAASVTEHTPTHGDQPWDDAPVTLGEFAREFVGGAFILVGAIVVAYLVLA